MTPETYKLNRGIKPVKPFVESVVLAQYEIGETAVFAMYFKDEDTWRIFSNSNSTMHSGDGLFGDHDWTDMDTHFNSKEEAIKCFQRFYGKPE